MGMAASQARFLQLTARKTNLEYMGQQINQERLSLANQSAGLFERQLTLDPPTPPSSLDDKYYTQGYTFTDTDGLQKKISWVDLDGSNAVNMPGVWYNPTAGTSGTINVFRAAANMLLSVDTEDRISDGTAGGGAAFVGIQIDERLEEFMGDDSGVGMNIDPQEDTVRIIMRYVTMEHDIYLPDGTHSTEQRNTPAILEFDNLNRLINMIPLDDAQITGDFAGADGTPYVDRAAGPLVAATKYYSGQIVGAEDLTYSGVFDENAFNDDMNEYEYKKATYDYEIERINMETAQIQEQDRSLELKMKQIDTEHKAISTEIDAVQKVIQKSVESSFKTFS